MTAIDRFVVVAISVMVFFMGCLAALNRLEVHSATEQERLYGRAAAELLAAAKERVGGDVMQALAALGQRAGEEPGNLTLKAAVRSQPLPPQHHASELYFLSATRSSTTTRCHQSLIRANLWRACRSRKPRQR